MNGRISHVIAQIAADPSQNWTVEKMAEVAELSPQHFSRLFSEIIGTPPHKYLTNARLDIARELLSDPRHFLSVKEIVAKCGFPNATNFAREFKKRYGLSPTQFREQQWGIHQSQIPDDDR